MLPFSRAIAFPHDDSETELRTLLDVIQEFIVLKDGEGRWLYANQAVIDAYRLKGIHYRGRTDRELGEIIPSLKEAFEYNRASDEEAWDKGSPLRVEKSFPGEDNSINTWEVCKTPFYDSRGHRCRLTIVSRNVTERNQIAHALKESERKYRLLAEHLSEQVSVTKRMAYHDPLTGIPNRRYLMEHIQQRIDNSSQRDTEFALLYLDLDRFKSINDSLGHDIGDELLIAFAQRIQHNLRPEDFFARIGGDEFVIVLPDVDRDHAVTIAQRMCTCLEAPWKVSCGRLETTSSIGIALYPASGDSAHLLLCHADAALYLAKRAGRSRINLHDPNMSHFTDSLPTAETTIQVTY